MSSSFMDLVGWWNPGGSIARSWEQEVGVEEAGRVR